MRAERERGNGFFLRPLSFSFSLFFHFKNTHPPALSPPALVLFPKWRPPKVSRRDLLAAQGRRLARKQQPACVGRREQGCNVPTMAFFDRGGGGGGGGQGATFFLLPPSVASSLYPSAAASYASVSRHSLSRERQSSSTGTPLEQRKRDDDFSFRRRRSAKKGGGGGQTLSQRAWPSSSSLLLRFLLSRTARRHQLIV